MTQLRLKNRVESIRVKGQDVLIQTKDKDELGGSKGNPSYSKPKKFEPSQFRLKIQYEVT